MEALLGQVNRKKNVFSLIIRIENGTVSLGKGTVVGERQVMSAKGKVDHPVKYLGFAVCQIPQQVRDVKMVAL